MGRRLIIALVLWMSLVLAWTAYALLEIQRQIEATVHEMEERLQEQTLPDFARALEARMQAWTEPLRVAAVMRRLGSPAPLRERLEMAEAVLEAAERYGVPVDWVLAVGAVESHWRPRARGSQGERGPLQVVPSTLGYLGMRCGEEVACQIEAGVRYLALTRERSQGVWATSIARYHLGHNASASAALRRGRRYVQRVEQALAVVQGEAQQARRAGGRGA